MQFWRCCSGEKTTNLLLHGGATLPPANRHWASWVRASKVRGHRPRGAIRYPDPSAQRTCSRTAQGRSESRVEDTASGLADSDPKGSASLRVSPAPAAGTSEPAPRVCAASQKQSTRKGAHGARCSPEHPPSSRGALQIIHEFSQALQKPDAEVLQSDAKVSPRKQSLRPVSLLLRPRKEFIKKEFSPPVTLNS